MYGIVRYAQDIEHNNEICKTTKIGGHPTTNFCKISVEANIDWNFLIT